MTPITGEMNVALNDVTMKTKTNIQSTLACLTVFAAAILAQPSEFRQSSLPEGAANALVQAADVDYSKQFQFVRWIGFSSGTNSSASPRKIGLHSTARNVT
jgi:hypothetical protein